MKTKLSLFCDKIIEAGWLAVVVAVPLFFNIYTARTFEPDKITLLRSIVSVMALAWLISVAERGVAGDSGSLSLAGRFRTWRQTPLFLPTLALVLAYIIATVFSLSPRVSLWGSYQRLQGLYSTLSYIVVFALIAGNLRSREQVDRLVTTIIITSIPIGLYGIVQRYGLDPLPWAGDVTTRVAANMGNAIFVASYLIMVIPLTLSRLIESMMTIIREEKASWGHTVLAAIYIFAAAVQMMTVVFTQSRGPMLGILGAAFVMGLLVVLILRRLHADPARLSLKEAGAGIGFVAPLGLAAAVMGGAGYLVGLGLQGLLRTMGYPFDGLSLLGAILGGLLGFFGLYIYMAAAGKGWRWLWLSWFATAVLGIGFVLLLNVQNTALGPMLDPIRQLPYVSRLSQITGTESGTGKVRVLIWDAAMELVAPHRPLGIPGDELAPPDRFNAIRPAIGYGPESMFNAFAFVYPPELAHVEARGSSADRSHNETMDSLVMTGVIGFLAFYFVMISVFYYGLNWLGWTPDRGSKRRLLALLVGVSAAGAVVAYLAQGRLTFIPLGLPFGIIAGSIIFLIWQGFIGQKRAVPAVVDAGDGTGQVQAETSAPAAPQVSAYYLLLIGLFGALVGHFIEVHFVFSIAATYTYFWVYAGLMLALTRLDGAELAATPAEERTPAEEAAAEADSEPAPDARRARKARSRRTTSKRRTGGAAGPASPARNWEALVGAQGLAMAIILVILVFDFVTPQFRFDMADKDSLSLLWMFVITWGMGLGIVLSELAVRQHQEGSRPAGPGLGRAGLLYGVSSLAYFFFYYVAHRLQLGQRITVSGLEDVVRAAGVLSAGLVVFYLFLLLLMVLIAVTLSWGQVRALPGWRSRNWWLYPPLALAVITVIWFKNVDVVRADIFLKEGERYRGSRQWQEAIALHEKARSLDSDEDFYYLMLALDYQLMAQDGQMDEAARRQAWADGEEIALEARRINPYNPDNTGNMGRYYFTLGQVLDPARYQDALTFFEKATVLAPSNVVYHNLWAQTYYVLQDYEAAVDRLEVSVALDSEYAPTWILLGDTYAAMGTMEKALEAHSQAMRLSDDFFDQYLDQRLNFYISAGLLEQAIAAMEQAAKARPDASPVPWAIAHAYNMAGQPDRAIAYLEQARSAGDTSDRVIRELARTYFNQNAHDQALKAYQALLQLNPNDVEAHSALAFIYAQQGRPAEAILHNQQVLQQRPNDYDSLKNLAILYQQQGQWQEALQAAQQARAVAPATETANWEQFILDLENQKNTPG